MRGQVFLYMFLCAFQMRKSKTVETNLKNINVNKFDLEFEVNICCIGFIICFHMKQV